jgi:cytochrome P450
MDRQPSARPAGTDSLTAKLPPGPRLPALFQAISLWRRPLELIADSAKRFGDCFTLRLPGMPPQVLFSHPDAVREIFTAEPEELRAGEANVVLAPILGRNSLLVLDGGRHLRERRLMQPPFHGERMRFYGDLMAEVADRVIEGWPRGRAFPVHAEMQAITLDVILRAVFGLDQEEKLPRLRRLLTRLVSSATNPALIVSWARVDLGPASPWGRFRRLRGEVDAFLLAEVAERRRAGTGGRRDILSMLVDARDEGGEPMGDAELCDQMITLLLAGHETTATALAWTLHRVLSNPAVLDRVRPPVGGDGAAAATEAPGRLEYLDATIKETLRLNPILDAVGRKLARPTRIGGWDLPAGVVAAPSIFLVHRRPDVWPDPERFSPERFLAARPGPYEFLPFGGGVRRCLGMAFALYEMRIVLDRVLARAKLRLAPGYRARTVLRSITLAPSQGMPVILDELFPRSVREAQSPSSAA